jgi:hypothetical protein
MLRLYQIFLNILKGAAMLKNLMQYFVLAICLCLVLSMVVFAESEPNNTPGTATPLAPNSSSDGILTVTTDNVDWWRIAITFDGSLVVNTTSDQTLDIDLHLYDQDGTTQIASYDTSNGIHEATHRYDLAIGTYYVEAVRYSGYGSYSISNVYVPTGLTNDSEPNDSSSIAQTLAPNSSITAHLGYYGASHTDVNDWWKVTTTFDGSLVVNTTSDPTLDIDLRMYDQDGKTQIASYDTSWGIHEATHHYNLTSGTYYVLAYRYSGQGSYTIANIFAPTGLAIDSEPNDSVQMASTLLVNNSATGHLGYFKRGVFDIYDWWKVALPNDGNLTVRTLSDPTLEIDLHMFDQDGITQIASYDTSWGIHEATHYYGLKAGTYFVSALGYNSGYCSSYGSYQISSQHTAAQHTNDMEPNDSLSNARVISLNSVATGHLGFFGNGTRDQYDFFTFILPVSWDTLFIRTDSDPTIDIDLRLYDQSGDEIRSSGSTGTTELLWYVSAGAGIYSVRLNGYGSGYGSYGIIVSNMRPNATIVSVQETDLASTLPKNFSLSQNYPNPFNPTTSISYTIPQGAVRHVVSIRIYDLLGREVATLVNEIKPAGTYTVLWNAANMPSGIYFYQLKSDNFAATKKLVLVK